ncbi:MAG TPA: hypothetical protein VJ608_08135 [Albitalea sp.]|nr:hypothetical protein [Albitalea sp.]
MHSATLPGTISLPRSQPDSWLEPLLQAWQRWALRRQHHAAAAAAAELSERVLRDIGAPDALLLEAQARRDADALRASELRLGLGRGAF